jgi:hypothetical protein
MSPFSSKSCECFSSILGFGFSFSFFTNWNVLLSWSYHCLATILSRYFSSCATVLRGSIFRQRPVRSMREFSEAARSSLNLSRRVRIWNKPYYRVSTEMKIQIPWQYYILCIVHSILHIPDTTQETRTDRPALHTLFYSTYLESKARPRRLVQIDR